MDNTWVQIISTLGFPTVACFGLAIYVKEQNKQNREDVRMLNEQYSNLLKDVTNAVTNNTIALTKLCDKIDREKVGSEK